MNVSFKNGNRLATLLAAEYRHICHTANIVKELPAMFAADHPLAAGAKAAAEFLATIAKGGTDINLNAPAAKAGD